MRVTFIWIFTLFIIPVLFIVGSIFLQLFLSKQPSKWPGLVLPSISFLFSLTIILSYAAFISLTALEILFQMIMLILLYNIPTMVFMAIYCSCRKKIKAKSQLEKMNVQDL